MRRWSIEASPQGPIYLGYRLGHIKSDGRVFRAVVYNKAAMVLHWKSLDRQLRLRGLVEKVSDRQADDYFNSRAYQSRIGAWASKQSQTLPDRDTFEQRLADAEREFDGREVARPPRWTGFRVKPETIEFWYGADFRLHERQHYEVDAVGAWSRRMLYP